MTNVFYPKFYFKYPLEYDFNPELYGSRVINPNMCEFTKQNKTVFEGDSNINGDLSKCRDYKVYKCPQKPYFGGNSTISFPDGLKYQDLPYFNPDINKYGMLTLSVPKINYNYNMNHGF